MCVSFVSSLSLLVQSNKRKLLETCTYSCVRGVCELWADGPRSPHAATTNHPESVQLCLFSRALRCWLLRQWLSGLCDCAWLALFCWCLGRLRPSIQVRKEKAFFESFLDLLCATHRVARSSTAARSLAAHSGATLVPPEDHRVVGSSSGLACDVCVSGGVVWLCFFFFFFFDLGCRFVVCITGTYCCWW